MGNLGSFASKTLSSLPTLGGTEGATPSAINDSGQIVGNSSLPSDKFWHPVRWDNGQITDLRGLVPDQYGNGWSAGQINNSGQILFVGAQNFNFLYPSVSLIMGYPQFINNSGQIVGTYVAGARGRAAFLSTSGIQDMGTPNNNNSIPFDMNNLGQVVGAYGDVVVDENSTGFLYSNGGITSLPQGLIPSSINNLGQIVGVDQSRIGGPSVFLWENGKITYLQEELQQTEIRLIAAQCINDRGQIVAWSYKIVNGISMKDDVLLVPK